MVNFLSSNDLEKKYPVALVMAGGTGGHIFPGLAVAKELSKRGWSIHWLGSVGGMEESLVSQRDIPLSLIAISGLRGNGILGWLTLPFLLLNAMLQARKVIHQVSPDVVLGFGGFASGPGGLVSKLMGKCLIIHEQNAIAGITNRMLSKFADKVFQAFPNTFVEKTNAETIGNPIREEILNLIKNDRQQQSHINNENSVIKVLVIGGSRGALALNQELPLIFSGLLKEGRVSLWHQCGETGYQITYNEYLNLNLVDQGMVTVDKFIDDMAQAYQWADVIICRAGALTVSEIAAVGIAAIFIPFPYAVDDHQSLNASWLATQNAGMIIPQALLSTEEGKNKIYELLNDRSKIRKMAKKASQLAFLDAAEKMAKASQESAEMAA